MLAWFAQAPTLPYQTLDTAWAEQPARIIAILKEGEAGVALSELMDTYVLGIHHITTSFNSENA
jgi:hypothetical protein